MLHEDRNKSASDDELKFLGIDPIIFQNDGTVDALLNSYKNAKRVAYKPQDIIYHEGANADTVNIISKGLVKLLSYLPNGRARIVRLHGPGHVIGLSSLVHPEYEHTAVATNNVELLKIPTSFIKETRSQNPLFYLELTEQWHHYLREADVWITQFSTGSIRSRVARLITFLYYLEKEINPGYVRLLSGEEMASILGVTPESVSRVIAEFKRQHIVEPVTTQSEVLFKHDKDRLSQYFQE
ncbi:MAG: Crp/Fnr family transcriptional regulator [Gammaproteobacteria bacterium]|jgi:CRP-like cAMP-binding protein